MTLKGYISKEAQGRADFSTWRCETMKKTVISGLVAGLLVGAMGTILRAKTGVNV